MSVVSLSEQTKWAFVIVIIASNSFFLLEWVLSICRDLRALMAKRMQKLFKILCLCCRTQQLERERLQVEKESQNEEIMNTLDDIAAGK